MKKILAIAAVSGVALAAFSSTPAFAVAAFPATDTYIALACDATGDPEYNLNSIAADGTATNIGTTLYSDDYCYADGSYNAIDEVYYVWDWNTGTMLSIDVTTGESTLVGDGTIEISGTPTTGVNGTFEAENGDHYMFDGDDPSLLYKVTYGATASDPSVATLVGTLPNEISTMADNPVSHKVYAQDPYGSLYEISLTDASQIAEYPTNCNTNQWGFGPGDCWGVDFDSNGTLWYQTDNATGNGDSMLASATLPATNGDQITLVEQGVFSSAASGDFYAESTGIIRPASAPELPNTGLNEAGALASAGSALLLVAGGLLLMRRRQA